MGSSNTFYKDACRPVRDAGLTEEVYPDDLCVHKGFLVATKDEEVLAEAHC